MGERGLENTELLPGLPPCSSAENKSKRHALFTSEPSQRIPGSRQRPSAHRTSSRLRSTAGLHPPGCRVSLVGAG